MSVAAALLLILVLIVAVPFGLAKLYIITISNLSGRARGAIAAVPIAFVVLAVWPESDDRYIQNFTEMTELPLRASAKLASGSWDIDEQLRRACSVALFEMPAADYDIVLRQVRVNRNLVPTTHGIVGFTRAPSTEFTRDLYFLNDPKHIQVNFCTHPCPVKPEVEELRCRTS